MAWWNNWFRGSSVPQGPINKPATSTPQQSSSTPNQQPLIGLRDTLAKASPGGYMGHYKQLQDALDGSFKKGGKVKKTGIYRLHKGEEVLTRKKAMAHKM